MEREDFLKSVEEKDERLEALKQLYPEIFSDGKINLDAFKDATGTSDLPEGEDKTPGYYGLYWPGKRAAKQLAKKTATGTLEPVPGDGVNEDKTHNIYIEGDNLEVLRTLRNSYRGRVKMIYIDPPYNTGSDFIYPDDFSEPVQEYLKITGQIDEKGKKLVANTKASGAYHRKWLNMMYPRLSIARDLLSEDGCILVSIDENENGNLRLLCDDIFGEENLIGELFWEATTQPINAGSAKYSLQQKTENIFVYSKKKTFNVEDLGNTLSYPHQGKFGKCRFEIIEKSDAGGYKRDTMKFKILGQSPRPGKRWQIGEETARELEKAGKIEIVDGLVKKAVYPEDELEKRQVKPFWSLLTAGEVGTAETGKNELNTLFGKALGFDTVKPTELMKKLIKHVTNDGDIILDFFSGTATTGHASMKVAAELNEERKFIMVQLPEKIDSLYENGFDNLCEVGKERLRLAGKEVNKGDIGFKVYRLNESNFMKYKPVQGQSKETLNEVYASLGAMVDPLVDGWKPENVLEEIKLRQGFTLDCDVEEVKSVTSNKVYHLTDPARPVTLYVCLDEKIDQKTVDALNIGKDDKFICLNSAVDDTTYARLADKERIETL